MRIDFSAAAVAIAAAVLACTPAAARHKPDPVERAAQFKPGVATYQDVVGTLGRPMMETVESDGSRTIQYGTLKSHAKAASYVPIVGLFVGGATATSTAVAFVFDAAGVLRRYTTQTGRADCGTAIVGVRCQGAASPVIVPQEAERTADRASTNATPLPSRPPVEAKAAQPSAAPKPPPETRQRPTESHQCGLWVPGHPDAVTC